MKTVKILKNYEDNSSYSQILQDRPLSFSIGSYAPGLKVYLEEYHPFTCREYFGDILLATALGKETSHYEGMSAKPLVFVKGVGLLILTLPVRYHNSIAKMVLAINEIEKKIAFGKTKLVGRDGDKLVISFSKKWTKSPLLLSAYTWLFRLSLYDRSSCVFDSLATDSFDISTFDELQELVRTGECSNDSDDLYSLFRAKRLKIVTDIILNQKILFKTNPLTGVGDKTYLKEISENIDNSDFRVRVRGALLTRLSLHSTVGCVAFSYNIGQPLNYPTAGHDWINALKKIRGEI